MHGIFDSHSHYNDAAFSDDLEKVLEKIQVRGVQTVVNVGADIDSSALAVRQAARYPFMYCSVGIHPEDADQALDGGIMDRLSSLAEGDRVVAIGEAGLDYHYDDRKPDEVQKEAFIRQIELANRTKKPLIIHSRDAMRDTIDILRKHPVHRAVVHCYSGSRESCRQLVRMGLYIGFTGVITFKNARRAIESLLTVPKDRILIETDCPYMAPVPFRGKRCDSSMIRYTARKMGEVLGMSSEETVEMTYLNACSFYSIEP